MSHFHQIAGLMSEDWNPQLLKEGVSLQQYIALEKGVCLMLKI